MVRNKLFVVYIITAVIFSFFQIELQAEDDNRMVLALYDSKNDNVRESNAHQLLEMPLNRLGMVVEYHNINDVIYPGVKKYRAIVVWLSDNVSKYGNEYYSFLNNAIDSGVKVILMNGTGITQSSTGKLFDNEAKDLLEKIGIKEGEVAPLENPFVVKYSELKKDAFDFEINEAVDFPKYKDYRIINNMMTSWMNVSRSDVQNSQAVVVAIGERGAFISDIEMVAKYVEDPVWGILWDLNPFKFFESALGLEKTLKPDVATFFGLRAAFIHIDGDGSSNMTIDISKEPQPCTQVLKEKILDVYPYPCSISAIAYRLTEEGSQGEKFVEILREIMKMPLVSPASHTYSHPMDWAKGILGFKISGYTFDPTMETVGSIEMIKQMILPPEKDIKLLLWSGNCEPTERSLAPLYSAGFENMNGGNARMDSLYKGICHICPLGIQVGKYRQCYAPAGNEYLYTDEWTKNFGGFAKVIDTFENTKKPRYLPVNVYYHFYLTERRAGLNSLIKVYDWCKTQDLCWIDAEDYTKAVTGFITAKTGRNGDNSYYIENYGGLNTVRLDNEARNVDMRKSKNVLGFDHFDNNLYVSLLPGERAEIILTDSLNSGLYIKNSTSKLRNVTFLDNSLTGEVCLYDKGYIQLGGINEKLAVKFDGQKIKMVKLNKFNAKITLPKGNGQCVRFSVNYVGK